MNWLEVQVATDGEGAEAVAEILRPFADDGGVVLEQLGDESTPDPDALEQAVTVKIFLQKTTATPALRHRIEEAIYHLGRLYPIPAPVFKEIQDQDWANAWKANYQPFRVGKRLWIQPSWIEWSQKEKPSANPSGDLMLILDPGMAFGTGTHPTTKLCLQALEERVRPGMRVLDVGTGSAILSIAAALLGAEAVLGVDNDETAVRTAVENVNQNHVGNVVSIRPGTLTDVAQSGWNIVVVNILAPVIMTMLSEQSLVSYLGPNGCLILSGILTEQVGQVEESIITSGGRIDTRLLLGDWAALIVQVGR